MGSLGLWPRGRQPCRSSATRCTVGSSRPRRPGCGLLVTPPYLLQHASSNAFLRQLRGCSASLTPCDPQALGQPDALLLSARTRARARGGIAIHDRSHALELVFRRGFVEVDDRRKTQCVGEARGGDPFRSRAGAQENGRLRGLSAKATAPHRGGLHHRALGRQVVAAIGRSARGGARAAGSRPPRAIASAMRVTAEESRTPRGNASESVEPRRRHDVRRHRTGERRIEQGDLREQNTG